MRTYIVSYEDSHGDFKNRHVEAKNHEAAIKIVMDEGFKVLSVDRDDDEAPPSSRKRLKSFLISIISCLIIAAACIAVVWFRSRRHM